MYRQSGMSMKMMMVVVVSVARGYRIQRRDASAGFDQTLQEQLVASEEKLKADPVFEKLLKASEEQLKADPILAGESEEYEKVVRKGMAAYLTMMNQTSAFNLGPAQLSKASQSSKRPAVSQTSAHTEDAQQVKGEFPKWQQEMMSQIVSSKDGSGMRAAVQMLAKSTAKRSEFCYGLVGAMPPAGEWDPAGFSKRVTESEMRKFREAELTHGRVSMLAAAGFLTQPAFHPLFDGQSGPAGELLPSLPSGAFFGIGTAISLCEGARLYYKSYFAKDDGIPGDYSWDPLGLTPEDPAKLRRLQEVELANSRLAMLGAAGFIAQESVSGALWTDWWATNAAPPSLLQVSEESTKNPEAAFNLGVLPTRPSQTSKAVSTPLSSKSLVKVSTEPAALPKFQQNLIQQIATTKDGFAQRAAVYMAARGKKTSDFCYGLPGSIPPAGEWDPLGLSKGASKETMLTYREAELTHGRIAMLASTGYIVQENYHPLFEGQTGPSDVLLTSLPPWVFFGITLGIGLCEFPRAQEFFSGGGETFSKVNAPTKGKKAAAPPERVPGDIGFDPLGLKPSDPAEFRRKQEVELSHGRLAMLASIGFVSQEGVSGETWSEWWGGLA